MSIGVAFSKTAQLGTSPISCVPCILSYILPWTMGQITIAMHVVFIALQIILLRSKYEPIQLLQLAVAFIFGYFTDFSNNLIESLFLCGNYLISIIYCFIGIVLVGFGVYIEVKADVVMLAGEGLVSAISKVTGKEFAKMKVIFDSTLVTIGTCLSLFFLGGLNGVREGTILAALFVGTFVKLYDCKFTFINRYFYKLNLATDM